MRRPSGTGLLLYIIPEINGWLTTEMHQSQPDSLSQNQPTTTTTTGETILHAELTSFTKFCSLFWCSADHDQALQEVDMQLSELDIPILANKIIISEILKLLAIQSDH